MLILFYKSALCPRCALARKHLKQFLGERYQEIVQEVDILKQPRTAWRNGIRMIPALTYDGDMIDGIMLSPEDIRKFVTDHCPGFSE